MHPDFQDTFAEIQKEKIPPTETPNFLNNLRESLATKVANHKMSQNVLTKDFNSHVCYANKFTLITQNPPHFLLLVIRYIFKAKFRKPRKQ